MKTLKYKIQILALFIKNIFMHKFKAFIEEIVLEKLFLFSLKPLYIRSNCYFFHFVWHSSNQHRDQYSTFFNYKNLIALNPIFSGNSHLKSSFHCRYTFQGHLTHINAPLMYTLNFSWFTFPRYCCNLKLITTILVPRYNRVGSLGLYFLFNRMIMLS